MIREFDPRLARMAAQLDKGAIKKATLQVFAAYGIDVPRGQIKAYRKKLLQEHERQEKIREERRKRLRPKDVLAKPNRLTNPFYRREIVALGLSRRDLIQIYQQLRKNLCSHCKTGPLEIRCTRLWWRCLACTCFTCESSKS